jgi:hypothetical protein
MRFADEYRRNVATAADTRQSTKPMLRSGTKYREKSQGGVIVPLKGTGASM